jgi:hypothetical protein
MLGQTNRTCTGVLLFCALAATAIAEAANASPVREQSNHISPGFTISQLGGHDTYEEGGTQMNPDEYVYGTVRGKVGSMLLIELEDGETLAVKDGESHIRNRVLHSGDEVIMTQEDDEYTLVGLAHPAWILTLQEDYKAIRFS